MINLKEIITKYPECLGSASKLRSYLVDLYPEEKARIRIIVDSFDCGIYEKIRSTDLTDKLFISGLCKKLENDYGYSNALSIWCIEQWTSVFDKNIPSINLGIKAEEKCFDFVQTVSEYKNIKVGDIITLGTYPQGANGEVKPIEWQVLNVEGNKALIISKYALDFKPFNTIVYERDHYITDWRKVSLRKWLNTYFYQKSFSENNKDKILLSEITADRKTGSFAQDKVFILSRKEILKYYDDFSKRKCVGTPYCVNKCDWKTDENNVAYWLCSFGGDMNLVACVVSSGSICGIDVGDCLAVRPAMWIKI